MRWSIIRLIWLRELRDQLRDRRTILMIAILPIVLYPLAGFGFIQLAQGYRKSVIIVEGADNLPQFTPRSTALGPVHAVAWLTVTPTLDGGGLAGVERVASAAVLSASDTGTDYPPLFLRDEEGIRVPSIYVESPDEAKNMTFRFEAIQIKPQEQPSAPATQEEEVALFLNRIERGPLERREADLLLVIPSDFRAQLEHGSTPPIYVMGRENDERSGLAMKRLQPILDRWKLRLKETRLARDKLPFTYDAMFKVHDPQAAKPLKDQVATVMWDLLAKILPVILIMWSLAGALYPAIDLCAGEKERGTMETLLISPASREEIVYGKFLTIWVFSALTALLNLVSMGLTSWLMTPPEIPTDTFRSAGLLWGVVLLLPVSAFFSAVCLAVGAYARSSKEGQYYLMPLFMVTMPLIFLTLAPDVRLNPFWSMVPVTGVALLLQSLIVPKPEPTVWYFFVPVLAPMVLYSWLALRWAIDQFNREEVLFREAERLDIVLWLKQLFREKERLPTAAEAVFCFLLIVVLNRLTLTIGAPRLLLVREGIRYLAFTAAPPLFMALLLTTRPRQGFALRLPPWWAWPAAIVLAVAITLPCAECIRIALDAMPTFTSLVEEYSRSVSPAAHAGAGMPTLWDWLLFSALVVVGAVSEEIAFRGFILTGLRQRYRAVTAVFLSSFLFALSQMNVFQFVPHFVLGAVLGFLVMRSGSLLPGIVFHLIYNMLVLGPYCMPNVFDKLGYADERIKHIYFLRVALAVGGSLVVALLLLAIARWTRPPVADPADEPITALPHIETKPFLAELATPPASTQVKTMEQRFHQG